MSDHRTYGMRTSGKGRFNRRKFVAGSLGGMSVVAGCLGDDDADDVDDEDDADGVDDTNDVDDVDDVDDTDEVDDVDDTDDVDDVQEIERHDVRFQIYRGPGMPGDVQYNSRSEQPTPSLHLVYSLGRFSFADEQFYRRSRPSASGLDPGLTPRVKAVSPAKRVPFAR